MVLLYYNVLHLLYYVKIIRAFFGFIETNIKFSSCFLLIHSLIIFFIKHVYLDQHLNAHVVNETMRMHIKPD